MPADPNCVPTLHVLVHIQVYSLYLVLDPVLITQFNLYLHEPNHCLDISTYKQVAKTPNRDNTMAIQRVRTEFLKIPYTQNKKPNSWI